MPTLADIRAAFATYSPRVLALRGGQQAAVAIILDDGADGPRILFIERAESDGDPWSGHMAFPGGRVDPGDDGPRQAAERETMEETGVDLSAAEPLSRLDDLEGRGGRPGLVVSAFVYQVAAPAALVPNHEVREALWVPLRHLLDPARHVTYPYPQGGSSYFPGILVGNERQVVWGLTYRFLEMFFAPLGRRLPAAQGRRPQGGD
jgi:8-oxo-dGTP pyrophosphatase MutT (NUDIX family)